jgi:hypothetical protein
MAASRSCIKAKRNPGLSVNLAENDRRIIGCKRYRREGERQAEKDD